MSTVTVSGTITFPIALGGPNASLVIGAPTVNPTSTTGPQLTFTEVSNNTYSVAVADGVVTIPFGTIAAGSLVYVGSSAALDVKFDGSSDAFSLEADGYILVSGAGLVSMTVQATLLTGTVQVLILGA